MNKKGNKLKYCACGKIGFVRLAGSILCLECYRAHPKTKRVATITRVAYARYLKSKKWRAKRLYKITKSGHKCEECGIEKEKGLEVHHLNYASLGNESLTDLQVLCHSCHAKIHDMNWKLLDSYRPWGALVGSKS